MFSEFSLISKNGWIRKIQRKVRLIIGQAEMLLNLQIPFGKGEFNLILCSNEMENDDKIAFRRNLRILR